MRIERRAKCERLAFSLTTGLKPLTCFRLKAGLWHVVIEDSRKARVPALAGSLQGPSGPTGQSMRWLSFGEHDHPLPADSCSPFAPPRSLAYNLDILSQLPDGLFAAKPCGALTDYSPITRGMSVS